MLMAKVLYCHSYRLLLEFDHRIKDDRMKNNIKGRLIWHCAFAASVFKVQRLRQY